MKRGTFMKNRKRLILLAAVLALLLVCAFSVMILAAETSEAGDVNGDGSVTSADAIYLLRHTILPDQYPLAAFSDKENSERIDTMQGALENLFDYEGNAFIKTSETCKDPVWTYTTSTFSGWAAASVRPNLWIRSASVCVRERKRSRRSRSFCRQTIRTARFFMQKRLT